MREKDVMKVVLQDGIKDCGICCLLSVIRFYDGDVSKEYLREITNTNKSGVSAYDLIEGAKSIGFDAVGVKGDLSKIEKNNLPCLAHVIVNKSYKHFVVIYDIDFKRNKVLIMDPAKGKVILNMSEFKLMSSMNYIFLKPVKTLPVFNKSKIIRKILTVFFRKNKIFVILIIVLTFVYFLFQIITTFHFKYLLEFSVNYKISNLITFLSIYVFFLYCFKEFTNFMRNILLTKILSKLDLEITFVTFKHILLLPYLYFKNRTTGEIISRIRDLNTIKNLLGQFCCMIFSDFVGFILFSFIMFRLNRKIFIIVSCICVFLFFIQVIFNHFRVLKVKKVNVYNDKINSYLIETITNIETIKGSHLEKKFTDVFKIKYQKLLEKNYSFSLFEEVFLFLKNISNNLLLVVILGYGCFFVVSGEMSLGQLLVYQNVFSYYLYCFGNLLNLYTGYYDFKLALRRIEDLFTVKTEKFNGKGYYLMCRLDGDIVIDNLNYNLGGKCLFNNLRLNISYMDKVLLTGESGSGKSTLVKLLLRYIYVPFGFISIKNIDINHYHLDNIRNNITYISNNDTLFTDTLYNNITLNQNVSKEEFLKITRITKVNEIVKNDRLGYQKLVEEDGFNFSSGEKQRIILARSLTRKSDIYIFDEAFSQIDIDKTRIILRNILEYLKDKTVIVISHRNNFNKLFNRVLKLEKGRIYEISKL